MIKRLLVIFFFTCLHYTFGQEFKLDSLAKNTLHIEDSLNVHTAADLIYELSRQEKFDTSHKYIEIFIKISNDIQYPKGTGKIFNEKAYVYNISDKPYEALKCFEKAGFYFEKANFNKGLAVINNNKAVIEQKLGNPEKSIAYLLEANEFYQKLNDSISLATTINNIGNVYLDIEDFEKAKKYYYQSLDLKQKYNVQLVAPTLNNLALTLIRQGKIDSASVVLNKSLKVSRDEKDSRSIAEAYISLGRIAVIKKEYLTAKNHYESALFMGGKVEHKNRMIRTKLALGEIGIKTGNLKEAEMHISFARQQAEKVKSIPLQLTGYRFSAMLDSAKQDYIGAYSWQSRYQKLFEQNSAEETNTEIEVIKRRLENEKKQLAELEAQRRKEQEAKEQLLVQKNYTYIAILAFIASLIFIFFIIKTRIERAKYIKKLNDLNQIKDKLFSIISHDLKNEINGLNGMLNLFQNQEVSVDEFTEMIPILSDSSNKTSLLLSNLLNWSKSQMNELKAKPSSFNLNQVINEKLSFFSHKAKEKGIKLINQLKDEIFVYADKDMISIISQNIIANAIKFCNEGDSIIIKQELVNNFHEVCFTDTGVGIAQDDLSKIFSDLAFTTYGTQNEPGTGLGLKICNDLITLNGGTISVDSVLKQGSTFCVSIPKTKS